tara:strand:+ start:586 stop:879 length:294 start_codon:yes stop_codon:yes gene_type:complete
MNTTTKLINSKWDAIASAQSSMNKARNDLFDNVALALSRIDGKMNFLNGENFEGKPFLKGHAQNVGFELQKEVQDARKALDKIFVDLTDAKEKLFNS